MIPVSGKASEKSVSVLVVRSISKQRPKHALSPQHLRKMKQRGQTPEVVNMLGQQRQTATVCLEENSTNRHEVLESVEFLGEEEEIKVEVQVDTIRNKFETELNNMFYPNAIHCLIALYHEQYQQMAGKSPEQIKSMDVWNCIGNSMKECLFNFSGEQVEQKFLQLRCKYFNVNSSIEIDNFEYFDQLHRIYQDPKVDAIASGETIESESMELRFYPDEDLLQQKAYLKTEQQNNEITEPKEHHFPNTMKKELSVAPVSIQAQMLASENCLKERNETTTAPETITLTTDKTKDMETGSEIANMSLAAFNLEQERRHQEQLAVMHQLLVSQSNILEMQKIFVEQLTKRL